MKMTIEHPLSKESNHWGISSSHSQNLDVSKPIETHKNNDSSRNHPSGKTGFIYTINEIRNLLFDISRHQYISCNDRLIITRDK